MTPGTFNFDDAVRGDTINARLFTLATVVDEVSTPIDITGWNIVVTFRKGNNAVTFTVGDGVTIVDAEEGQFRIDAFALNKAGVWVYDIETTDMDDVVKTYIRGQITILGDVPPNNEA